MKTLKQRFSLWYTTHHGNLEGSIWQGRFHSTLVENSTAALSAVSAYIDRNPVRAGIVDDAKDYAWCGYGAACHNDLEAREGILFAAAEGVGAKSADHGWKAKVWRRYRQTVSQGSDAKDTECQAKTSKGQTLHKMPPWHAGRREAKLSRGLVVGSPLFVKGMIKRFRAVGATRTRTMPCGIWRGSMLCCAGRGQVDGEVNAEITAN